MKTLSVVPLFVLALSLAAPALAQVAVPGPTPREENLPPAFSGLYDRTVRSGGWLDFPVDAIDPEGDPLTYSARNLPRGAHFDPATRYFQWSPGDFLAGEFPVTFIVTDGRNTVSMTITITVEEEWESYFMPGVNYTLYAPAAEQELGMFMGASVEFLLAAWIHRNENRGPSHGRVYLKIELLGSTREKDPEGNRIGAMMSSTFGLGLSLERNPQRSFLIPYFGLEMGGLYQDKMDTTFILIPFAGLHLWSSRNIFVNAMGGYLYPFGHVGELNGWYASAGLDISIW
jgi:hypothetical protein